MGKPAVQTGTKPERRDDGFADFRSHLRAPNHDGEPCSPGTRNDPARDWLWRFLGRNPPEVVSGRISPPLIGGWAKSLFLRFFFLFGNRKFFLNGGGHFLFAFDRNRFGFGLGEFAESEGVGKLRFDSVVFRKDELVSEALAIIGLEGNGCAAGQDDVGD